MLIECKECGGKVSDDADACPSCGFRIRGRQLLVQCSGCGESVIPELYAHDPGCRYCPLCHKTMSRTIMWFGLKIFWALVFAALIIGAIWGIQLVLSLDIFK